MGGRRILKVNEVIEFVKEKGSQIFTLDNKPINETNFGKVKDKYLFKCINCGEIFQRTYDNFKTGQLCLKCGKAERGLKGRSSNDKYLEKLKEVGAKVVPLEPYLKYDVKIKHFCPSCKKEFLIKPSSVLRRGAKQCPKCVGKVLLTTEQFAKEVDELTSGEYKLVSEYTGANAKVKIIHFDCGRIFEVTPHNFKSNGRRCSHCFKNHKKNTELFEQRVFEMVGEEYSVVGDYVDNRTKITMRHNKCGNIYDVTPANFISNKRCPCCIKSKGEEIIESVLIKLRVRYITQCRINGCKAIKPLKFDFVVFDNNSKIKLIIEYDGEQHFKPIELFGGKKEFVKTQRRDAIKNEFCEKNGIELIRIPYWEFDNIERIIGEKF